VAHPAVNKKTPSRAWRTNNDGENRSPAKSTQHTDDGKARMLAARNAQISVCNSLIAARTASLSPP